MTTPTHQQCSKLPKCMLKMFPRLSNLHQPSVQVTLRHSIKCNARVLKFWDLKYTCHQYNRLFNIVVGPKQVLHYLCINDVYLRPLALLNYVNVPYGCLRLVSVQNNADRILNKNGCHSWGLHLKD